MNQNYNDLSYVFHATKEYSDLILSHIKKSNLNNCEVISDNKIKNHILKKSVFAVSKSGTISLEICNAKIELILDELNLKLLILYIHRIPSLDLSFRSTSMYTIPHQMSDFQQCLKYRFRLQKWVIETKSLT